MVSEASSRIGCLLGMAAGDALGCGADHKTLEEIYADYGPGGLQGYDPDEELARISSHTQLAAMAGCGLLVALSRGRTESARKYIAAALQEWSSVLLSRRVPDKTVCWLSRVPAFTARNCKDSRLPLGLSQGPNGTPEAPINRTDSVSALMAPVAVGLFYQPKRMEQAVFCRLAVETAALTHGAQEAYLSGGLLAILIARIIRRQEATLEESCQAALTVFLEQFSEEFSKAAEVALAVRQSIRLARNTAVTPCEVLEQLPCDSAKNCLAAAVYVCLRCGDMDSALVAAVNHSGPSAAVGAVTGALMGAWVGGENIPDFYLDCLEGVQQLRTLAEDLTTGSATAGLFDSDWDQKYQEGFPV